MNYIILLYIKLHNTYYDYRKNQHQCKCGNNLIVGVATSMAFLMISLSGMSSNCIGADVFAVFFIYLGQFEKFNFIISVDYKYMGKHCFYSI